MKGALEARALPSEQPYRASAFGWRGGLGGPARMTGPSVVSGEEVALPRLSAARDTDLRSGNGGRGWD